MAFTKNLLLVAVTLLAVFAVSDAAFCEHPGPFDPRTASAAALRAAGVMRSRSLAPPPDA
jgi:hypothetical protein